MKFQNWQNWSPIVAIFGRLSTEKGSLWDARNVLYLALAGGFSGIDMSKNPGGCTLKIFGFYCMYIIP